MTRLPAAAAISIRLGLITPENLDACARVIARLAVEKTLIEHGLINLDSGQPPGDNVGNQHKSGPAGVGSTDEAKERVT
jgi:hypothetical protein